MRINYILKLKKNETIKTYFLKIHFTAKLNYKQKLTLSHAYHWRFLPTPLEFCPRLSKLLGGPDIFIKRDDLTGLAFGGNKTRQLEFLLPKVLNEDFDILVAGAYSQSNWCRQITAAARKLEKDVMLVLVHGEKGGIRQGNLLNELMGAR